MDLETITEQNNEKYPRLLKKIEPVLRVIKKAEPALNPLRFVLCAIPILGPIAYLGGKFVDYALEGKNDEHKKLSFAWRAGYFVLGTTLLTADTVATYGIVYQSMDSLK